ncbi:MAG: hypothetical protein SCJ97_09465 [Bacillota bacterium]|nr:hypothetical protein [Bacillota bacterium]
MVLENPKNININNVEEHFVRIYKKSSYRNSEEDIKDDNFKNDDSDMKIFEIK